MFIKLKCCKCPVRPEANRPWVLRERKVLPEVRNRLLLLREFFSFSIFKKCYESNTGTFRLTHSISDIPMTPSCSLRSFGIGGWCVVSCMSVQISKFTVQAYEYAIRYVMVYNSDKSPPRSSLPSFSLVLSVNDTCHKQSPPRSIHKQSSPYKSFRRRCNSAAWHYSLKF